MAKTRSEIEAETVEAVRDYLGETPDRVHLTSTLEDLQVDSLEAIEVGIMVEEQFDIEIPDATMEAWKSVQDIVRDVEAILNR